MASRTRERLIDVARQLFVRQGIDNVTMNDIATASDRGRRTVYTYFRTKSDIFQAVVENEAQRVLRELEQALSLTSTPTERLKALLEFRFTVPHDNRHDHAVWFRSLFSRDSKRINSMREIINARIYTLIDEIVADGIRRGDFNPAQASRLASMVTFVVRGSDWTQISGLNPDRRENWRRDCIEFILSAIQSRP